METEEEKAKRESEEKEKKEAEANKPISKIDEAKKVLEDTKTATEELKAENDRREKLKADDLLSSTAGGHVAPTEQLSPEQEKTKNAKEFFKDTALGDAIKKANE